jgi:hypothetical protein
MNKLPFYIVDFNSQIILDLSKDAYDFCELWQSYLLASGWTEEAYEAELSRQVFDASN